jgi:hypothetical protein
VDLRSSIAADADMGSEVFDGGVRGDAVELAERGYARVPWFRDAYGKHTSV